MRYQNKQESIMHLSPIIIASALLLGTTAAQAARLAPEEEIAKAISGRVEGKPVDCIYQHDIRSSRIVDRTAIIYEMSNGTIYLNRPESGATSMHWDDVLVTDTHGPELCRVDIIHLYNTSARMQTGSISPGMFVPYTRAPRNKRL
jgi:hypothetical protein